MLHQIKLVTVASTSGAFSGFAWGSQIMGWLQFNIAGSNGVCEEGQPGCGGGGITNSLSLTADSGAFTNATTLTVQKNSTVTVHWNIQNMTNCQINTGLASVSNSSSIPTGLSTVSTVSNSGNISYATVGQRTLTLSCDVPNSLPLDTITKPVYITVTDTIVTPSCVLPGHAAFCPTTDQINTPKNARANASLCTNNTTCEYYCTTGFKLSVATGLCVKSSIREI